MGVPTERVEPNGLDTPLGIPVVDEALGLRPIEEHFTKLLEDPGCKWGCR